MITIRLLGAPLVERHGEAADAPRGTKVWALLAYLLLSEVPPSRHRLAELVAPEADDPSATLRWSLSQLRRLLGPDADVSGDPVTLQLPPATSVDVAVLLRGSWVEAATLPTLGQPLLGGIDVPSSPALDLWLATERRRLQGASEGVLHRAALARLGSGHADEAVESARRLVDLAPLDENAHVLLVRCLVAAGELDAAGAHVEAATQLLRRELGLEPTAALGAAAAARPPVATRTGRATVLAHLEAGESAVNAGALDSGVESLRAAVHAARGAGDDALLARALVVFGTALVHAVRGTDEEALPALTEGGDLALRVGDHPLAAQAKRELGYVDVLRARYDQAATLFAEARDLAGDDDAELAWIDAFDGMGIGDIGDHARSETVLRRAIERGERAGAERAAIFARAALGRLLLLRSDPSARAELERALDDAQAAEWVSFVPWPESFLAELDLRDGDIDLAAERFEHAFAIGSRIGDPCWDSMGVRGLGLVAAARGELDRALELLDEAPRRCHRLPDAYLWVEAYGLDALADVASRNGLGAAPTWCDRYAAFVERRGMREFAVRAAVYRARLGAPGAAALARMLAEQVDNPALGALVDDLPEPALA